MPTQISKQPIDAQYAARKERARAAQAVMSESGRDIGAIPAVVNAARKKRAEFDFRFFCEQYFSQTFILAWSQDHLRVIDKIEQAVLFGGLFALAMPRGSGKSSLCEAACIWAILYGHHQFVILIGSSEEHAQEMLASIKTEIESNELLAEDFPEVCYPIECLDGIANRCKGQLQNGESTHIAWTVAEIVLPTIKGSAASGAIIRVAGITGRIRGMKFKRRDGKSVRPSLAVLDDPQSDESANSDTQCKTRERVLAGAVLGLAGPGKKISGIMPCTVIRAGDMADAILNRDNHPEWNGERTKMVYKFPVNEKLWEEYAHIRADSLRAERGIKDATEFYLANRVALDEGAEVAWPARFNPDEASALQHAMNLKLQSNDSFFSEYQNDPIPEIIEDDGVLSAGEIAKKLNGMARYIVPIGVGRLTMFIDVQGKMLFYTVVGWEDNFSGYVLDYGTYPDQKRNRFTLRDAQKTLQIEFPAAGIEAAIYAGLETLTKDYLAREWSRDDGAKMKIERCLIDANWGDSTDVIYQFCRQSEHATVLLPSHGKFVGAASMPFAEYKRKPGERVGHNWRIPTVQGKRAIRHVLFDTNYWKSFIHARLAVKMGDAGCLSLWGRDPHAHELFSEQLVAEHRIKTEGRGRVVYEWKLRPNCVDNHWLDCYDDQTDVLTRKGWKRFSCLDKSDELATVNLKSDLIEYQLPTDLISKVYSGKMIQIGGKTGSRINLCVTPKHRMVVLNGQGGAIPEIKIANSLTIWDKIKRTAKWKGKNRKYFQIKATTRHPSVRVSTKDLAALLGWYIAEGSCRFTERNKTCYTVISQIRGVKRDSIRALFKRLPWRFHEVKDAIVTTNRQVYELVKNLGNKYTKSVPQWIKDSSSGIISEFMKCAVDGDGWRQRKSEAYATTSIRLADDVQELWLKMGYGVSCKVVNEKTYNIRGRSGLCRKQFHVFRGSSKWGQLRDYKNKPNFETIDYSGIVYCASVPNQTLIVRRGGKISICGNCIVGSAVAAAMSGSTLKESGASVISRGTGKKLKLSELQHS